MEFVFIAGDLVKTVLDNSQDFAKLVKKVSICKMAIVCLAMTNFVQFVLILQILKRAKVVKNTTLSLMVFANLAIIILHV